MRALVMTGPSRVSALTEVQVVREPPQARDRWPSMSLTRVSTSLT